MRQAAAVTVGQPCGDRGGSGERSGAECEKADAPAEPVGENAGGDAADKAAESGAADVEAHDEGDAIGRPLLADVGDENGDDAGHHDALQESPEDELRERSGSGGQQRGNRDAEERSDDDALARQSLGECAEDGCGDGDAESGRGDGHADAGLGGVKEASQQRQKRLRAVKLKKGADAAQGHGRGGHVAGLGWRSGWLGSSKDQDTG